MGDTETISIIEGNKIIAEFMGGLTWIATFNLRHEETGSRVIEVEKIGDGSTLRVAYHSSWDWLMPVVEKISKWYDEESDTVNVDDFLETNLKIFNLTIFSSINEVWLACIEFINWIIKSKQNETL